MDEKFFAWRDGELDPAEAAEMEKRVAADPELARAAENHRALGATLRSAFARRARSRKCCSVRLAEMPVNTDPKACRPNSASPPMAIVSPMRKRSAALAAFSSATMPPRSRPESIRRLTATGQRSRAKA